VDSGEGEQADCPEVAETPRDPGGGVMGCPAGAISNR
jgi:hypothetical protein